MEHRSQTKRIAQYKQGVFVRAQTSPTQPMPRPSATHDTQQCRQHRQCQGQVPRMTRSSVVNTGSARAKCHAWHAAVSPTHAVPGPSATHDTQQRRQHRQCHGQVPRMTRNRVITSGTYYSSHKWIRHAMLCIQHTSTVPSIDNLCSKNTRGDIDSWASNAHFVTTQGYV